MCLRNSYGVLKNVGYKVEKKNEKTTTKLFIKSKTDMWE